MSSIDERVVEMRFDNKQFGSGIKTTLDDLGALQKGLQLNGASKGLEEVGASAGRIGVAFSTMQIVAITALSNIVNRAVDAGIQITKSLSLDQVSAGFAEYELKLSSIQTIMAGSGESLEVVNEKLQELNQYADRTIYSFADMTQNIGKFTNAGVSLNDSVAAIQGVANVAAISGANAGEASRAMYNFAQALSAGYVKLIDWKSIELANMGTAEFKQQLIDTAVAMGTLKEHTDGYVTSADNVLTATKGFNDTLADEWLTAEVLTTTLARYSDATTDIGGRATAAAQDVKTFTQMLDTLRESAGSGWAETWEIVFGNFDEAKALWTGVNNFIGGFIEASSDARNKVLGDWKELGGRTVLIEGISTAFENLMNIIRPIGMAFRQIFPAKTGQDLYNMTVAFRDLVASLKPSATTIVDIQRTFAGLFAVLGIGWELIKAGVRFIGDLIGKFTGGAGSVLEFTGNIGDFLVNMHQAVKDGEFFTKFFDSISSAIDVALGYLRAFRDWIKELFSGISFGDSVDGLFGSLADASEPLTTVGDYIWAALRWIGDAFEWLWDKVSPIIEWLGDRIADLMSIVGDFLDDLSFDRVIDLIQTGLFGVLVVAIRNFLSNFSLFGDGGEGLLSGLTDGLEQLTDTLGAMQNALNAAALLGIAVAIGVLALAVLTLSGIKVGDLYKAIGAIAVMVTELAAAAWIFSKFRTSDTAKLAVVSVGLTLLATALVILSHAVENLSALDWEELGKGIGATVVLIAALAGAVALMSGNSAKMITTATGLVILASAIKILVTAVKDLSELNWEELAKGLISTGGLLTALLLFTKFSDADKVGVLNGAGILLLATGIAVLAGAVEDLSKLTWEEMAQGLVGVAVGLAALAGALKLLPEGRVLAAAGIVITASALGMIADAVEDLSDLDWEELARGLTGVAGGLAAVAGSLRALPARTIISSAGVAIVVSVLTLIADAVERMAKLSWEEVGRGVGTIIAALAGIAVALKLIPPTSIFSAIGIGVIAVALGLITDALVKMGGQDWGEVIKGLVTMAGALAIIGVMIALLSTGIGAVGALALAVSLIGIAFALGMLADVVVQLGEMSWSDIGAAIGGLALLFVVLAVGGALSPLILALAIALGVLAGAVALAGGGIYLAGKGIDSFADAMQKLSEIDAQGVQNIIDLFVAFISLIPSIATAAAQAIVNFVTTLGDNADEMASSFGDIIIAFVEEIGEKTPLVVGKMMDMVTATLTAIGERLPEFIDKGADLIVKFINGIASNVAEVARAGTNLIIEFLAAIGREGPRLIDAAFKVIIRFVNGLATAIRENGPKLREAAGNLASAIIDGITDGIFGGESRVVGAMNVVSAGALESSKRKLKINSPSLVFRDVIGKGISEGIAVGVEKYGYIARDSTENMGQGLLDTMGKSIAGLGDLIGGDFDLSPTITPVLDLSTVKKEAQAIGSMLATKAVSVDAAYSRALNAAALHQANADARAEIEGPAEPGDSITFIQNNSSPKALSPAEIYRQTNNQLSVAKGALTNAN